MTTYAICRDYEEGESFPCMIDDKLEYIICNDTKYECWQPDDIEDDEFNLVILLNNIPVKARGIHFDFV